jgi:fatty-acyl-CoA synthase
VLAAATDLLGAGFYQYYGQTETGMNAVLRPEDHATRAHCTGREMFNAEIRIVDEDGCDVRVGSVGEVISAQRPLGMLGYFANEEATRTTVRDGWIYTGDLARVEGDGYFTIVDRKTDMIISGGENIYPKEIEEILARHPAVAEVAVFGIPDERYGEAVCAAVVLREGHPTDTAAMTEFCGTRLAGYKKPRRIDVHRELPKNAAGKVTKHVLREPYWAGRARRV